MSSVYTLRACGRCKTGTLRLDETTKVRTCTNCGYEDYTDMAIGGVDKPLIPKGEFDDFINHVKEEWIILGRKYRGSRHITQTGFVGDPKFVLLKLIARITSVVEFLTDSEDYEDAEKTLAKLSDLLPVLYNQVENDIKLKEE